MGSKRYETFGSVRFRAELNGSSLERLGLVLSRWESNHLKPRVQSLSVSLSKSEIKISKESIEKNPSLGVFSWVWEFCYQQIVLQTIRAFESVSLGDFF